MSKAGFRRIFKDAPLLALLDRIVAYGTNPEPFRAYLPGSRACRCRRRKSLL